MLAALFTIALWWFSTGVVLLAVRRWPTSTGVAMLLVTLLALAGFAGLYLSRDEDGPLGAYVAFSSALLVWAWHEVSFLTGLVTGPRTSRAPPTEAHGRAPLRSAIATLLYHELGIAVSGAIVLAITFSGENGFGLATFVLLWVMRISAKFNLYLGVPNLGEAFLPPRLAYLESYFCRRPLNYLFPVSVTVATIALGLVAAEALNTSSDAGDRAGYALIATLLALAILEHWFMVLPFEATALWKWGLPATSSVAASQDNDTPKTLSRHVATTGMLASPPA